VIGDVWKCLSIIEFDDHFQHFSRHLSLFPGINPEIQPLCSQSIQRSQNPETVAVNMLLIRACAGAAKDSEKVVRASEKAINFPRIEQWYQKKSDQSVEIGVERCDSRCERFGKAGN
jgi:hypothetical protein